MGYIFAAIILFLLAVIFVKEVFHHPLDESVRICRNFILDIMKSLVGWEIQPPASYPVHIGFDGYNIIPRLVDVELKDMITEFPVCYCDRFNITDHTIQYHLPLVLPDQFYQEKESLELLIQKKAEKCVSDHLKKYGCYVPAEPLTVTEIFDSYMLLTVAKDPTGLECIAQKKQEQRRNSFLEQKQQATKEEFMEKWEQKED